MLPRLKTPFTKPLRLTKPLKLTTLLTIATIVLSCLGAWTASAYTSGGVSARMSTMERRQNRQVMRWERMEDKIDKIALTSNQLKTLVESHMNIGTGHVKTLTGDYHEPNNNIYALPYPEPDTYLFSPAPDVGLQCGSDRTGDEASP